MLTRSRYQQAYKKLGDLHRRWHEAKRLLAPAVDSLPQLLILPVTLFVIGLLDNMLSSAIPLSSPFNAVFVAGILSSVFAVAVGAYVVWTVVHGCLYPEHSPFQTTISRLIVVYGPFLLSSMTGYLHGLYFWRSRQSRDVSAVESGIIPTEFRQNPGGAPAPLDFNDSSWEDLLEPHEYTAFHATLQQLHDDDVLDQAVAALPSLIGDHSNILPRNHNRVRERRLRYGISSLLYMLSPEASMRCNVTAASFISEQTKINRGKFSVSPGLTFRRRHFI